MEHKYGALRFVSVLMKIIGALSIIAGILGLAVLVAVMIKLPLANAGSPDEPAPPTAIM